MPVKNPMIETPYFNIAAPGGTDGGEVREEEVEKIEEVAKVEKLEE